VGNPRPVPEAAHEVRLVPLPRGLLPGLGRAAEWGCNIELLRGENRYHSVCMCIYKHGCDESIRSQTGRNTDPSTRVTCS